VSTERRDTHEAHEDERNRDRREKRATTRAIADERLLTGRRLDALLAYDPSVAPVESDFPGCVY
jgi:hypothetical protein